MREGTPRVDIGRNLLEAFRDSLQSEGANETYRKRVISRHDPSIMFTNSTISVLKSSIGMAGMQGTFLAQPALRTHNLDNYIKTGKVSGFGCSFVALGGLFDAPNLGDAVGTAAQIYFKFLSNLPWIDLDKVTVAGSDSDLDLTSAAKAVPWRVRALGGDVSRYRSAFGIPGFNGRSLNVWIESGPMLLPIGSIITIERDTALLGVEIGMGSSTIIMADGRWKHPIHTTPAGDASPDVTDLMTLDALMGAAVLAIEGLMPRQRGRSRRYRQFLNILVERHPGPRSRIIEELTLTAYLEVILRGACSPLDPADGTEAPSVLSDMAVLEHKFARDLDRVAHLVKRGI